MGLRDPYCVELELAAKLEMALFEVPKRCYGSMC